MKILTTLLCTLSSVYAIDARTTILATSYQAESHEGNIPIVKENGNANIGYIRPNSWVRYDQLDFGPGTVDQFNIRASSGGSGGTVKVWLGSIGGSGQLLCSIDIPTTSGWGDYRSFRSGMISQPPANTPSAVFFEFVGAGTDLFNVSEFSFATTPLSWRSDVEGAHFLLESHSGDDAIIKKEGNKLVNATNGSSVDYGQFDFGEGMNYLWIEAATSTASQAQNPRKVEFRTGSLTGDIIGTLEIPNTEGLDKYKPLGLKIPTISGPKKLFLSFSGASGDFFNIGKFRFQRLAPDHKPTEALTARIKRDPELPWTPALSFSSESHPAPLPPATDNTPVRAWNGGVGFINPDSWVRYEGHNLPAGVNRISIEASSGRTDGGQVEVYLAPNSATEPPTESPLVSFHVLTGANSGNFQTFSKSITTTATGPQNVFFKFKGTGGNPIDFGRFRFDVDTSIPAFPNVDRSSGVTQLEPNSDVITGLTDGSWVRYDGVNFGQSANLFTVLAATNNKGGAVQVRLDSPTGPLVAKLDVSYTGSMVHFREYTEKMLQPVSGIKTVYLSFVATDGQSGNLFNLNRFTIETKSDPLATPSNQGSLTLYPGVSGLAPSPYYTYSVKKVSDLNGLAKHDPSHWTNPADQPFAWFSECKLESELQSGWYYNNFIAGWSNTYCNFEMGQNTPIVVKISRASSNPHGAPAGPIFMANAHPAHKVESCEVINGDVYVTMREPALVTVDIDGQMDTRDASGSFKGRAAGCHAASIFANPVILDKPAAPPASLPNSGPILYIEPGGNATAKMNSRNDWTTLYFMPGVHSLFGFDAQGNPETLKAGVKCPLSSNKTIYIPGNAMVYGCFDSDDGVARENIRIYGHGTLSGRHVPHARDGVWWNGAGSDRPGLNHSLWGVDAENQGSLTGVRTCPIVMHSMTNCRYEGVTIADPANHGIFSDHGSGNTRRWLKQISWRANTDMGGIPGLVEDCFFRLQDDGPYVGPDDFRRNTLWFDVNGLPFRCSFMNRGTHNERHQTVIEDIDIIYVRASFGGTVTGSSELWDNPGAYLDGAKNTAQHMIFRNIRVTDPRPTRSLFGFTVPAALTSGIAGIRFENVEFRHPQSKGDKNSFTGTAAAPITHLYFDGVTIEGKKMTQALLDDPFYFQHSNTSNFVFRDAPSSPRIISSPINTTSGVQFLNYDAPQNAYVGNGTLRVSSDGSLENRIDLDLNGSAGATNFAMTGGLISIDSGVTLVNGGWQKGVWSSNKANMLINGTLDLWDGHPVFVDALDGQGKVVFEDQWTMAPRILNVGVNGGSGTFSGEIEGPSATRHIQLVKQGSGTQTLNNLTNQKPKEIIIQGGNVNLAGNDQATMASNFSGAGNLIKSGTGTLTLSGAVQNIGEITVSQGTLKVPNGLSTQSKLTVAAGAMVELGGYNQVTSLNLGGIALPYGSYNSSTHSAFLTGTTVIQVTNIPLPWKSVDVGTGMLLGSVSFNNSSNTFTQAGAGMAAAMNVTNDKLRFTYTALQGEGHIIARISEVQNTGGSARIGVMIRGSLAGNSMHAFMGVNGTPSYRWARRTTIGGQNSLTSISNTLNASNIWVKLERTGNITTGYTIKAFISNDNGQTWVSNPSNPSSPWSITDPGFGENCYIGLAVSSSNDGVINTSKFSNVGVFP